MRIFSTVFGTMAVVGALTWGALHLAGPSGDVASTGSADVVERTETVPATTVEKVSPAGDPLAETAARNTTRDGAGMGTIIPATDAEVAQAEATRATYRLELARCVGRSGSCRPGVLSKEDRDYLDYELGDQEFDADTLRKVVDVRMEGYGRRTPTIVGTVAARRPEEPRSEAPARTEGGGDGGQVGQLTRNLGRLGDVLLKKMESSE